MSQRERNIRLWDSSCNKMYYEGFWVSCNYPNSDGDIFFDPKIFKKGKYNPLCMQRMDGTGLTDKNGKEIYELDILQGKEHEPAKVYWVESRGQWWVERESGGIPLADYLMSYKREVIGNIYENPELLNPEREGR